MPPNLLPIVSTGRPSAATASVQPSRAMIEPGMRRVIFGHSRMMARETAASAMTNTPITVRLIGPIRSDTAAPGSVYRASLDTSVCSGGRVVIPAYSSASFSSRLKPIPAT